MPESIVHSVQFETLTSNSFKSIHSPDNFGTFDEGQGYGGWLIAFAINTAAATVSDGYNVYSVTGNFLGAAGTTDVVQSNVITVRDTKTFATRRVELSQTRTFLIMTVDFAKPEQRTILTYSASPQKSYTSVTNSQTIDDYFAKASETKVDPRLMKQWRTRFMALSRKFERRGLPDSLMDYSLAGMLKHRWSNADWDKIPMPERTSGEYLKHYLPLNNHLENVLAIAFLADSYSAYTPILFARIAQGDLRAAGSLEFALRIFTNDLNVNEWVFKEETTPVAGEGRSYSESRMWNEKGQMIANMTQQGLLRPAPAKL